MNNPQDINLRNLDFVYNEPAHADCLPVDFCFSRDLRALAKCQGIFLDTINGFKYFITDTNLCKGLMFDVSVIAGNIVYIL